MTVRMASADEILRRSSPARPPSDADKARQSRRALQFGWTIRAETGDAYSEPGEQRVCSKCAGTGGVACGYCRGHGITLSAEADRVRMCNCIVCSGRRQLPCPSCVGTGSVAAWAIKLDALGDTERRVRPLDDPQP
jgi:hypothetical protein